MRISKERSRHIKRFLALFKCRKYIAYSRRMHFGIYYDDVYVAALVVNGEIILETEKGQIRHILLDDISRFDFIEPYVRLMWLTKDDKVEVGPATYATGTKELDGIVFVPADH